MSRYLQMALSIVLQTTLRYLARAAFLSLTCYKYDGIAAVMHFVRREVCVL